MKYYEAPESVKYHGGFDPSDPPQGERWCSTCSRWDEECECHEPETEPDNATNETGGVCAFVWDWESSPRRCYQCGELEDHHQ